MYAVDRIAASDPDDGHAAELLAGARGGLGASNSTTGYGIRMRFERLRERVVDAFWLLPALCVGAAIVLALGLVRLDEGLQRDGGGIAFTGGPSSARDLLSAIASSTLTLTGLVFSVTLVVLQLTSSQFSPRVLRGFLHDRRNQLTLGVFTATFVYALVVLRAVRGEEGLTGRFVPGIAVSVAFALALLSVAVLVAHIHHITQSIRVVDIIGRITEETEAAIQREYPHDLEPLPLPAEPAGVHRMLPASAVGVVTVVERDRLVRLAERSGTQLRLVPRVGDFVPRGAPLLAAWGGELDDDEARRAVLLERERSVRQDVAFGFRQLVDIAERALSPGVNDPTTAVQCLDQAHHLLRQLAGRPYPSGVHVDGRGEVRLIIPSPTWADHVALALDEVRHWGAASLQVHRRIRALVLDLFEVVAAERRPPLERQLALLDARLDELPGPERPAARRASGQGTSDTRNG